MIEVKNVYKKYRNHRGSSWVLEDINLIIPKNISVGLVGKNGAGKSTLLRIISGMDMPDKGEVIRHTKVSWPIGLSGGFNGSMTGRQNVKFVARIHGYENEIERIINYVESFAEIGKAFDDPVKSYSSGMKARLAFGLSLAFEFDVYISDEATAVGDRSFRQKASKEFKERVNKSSLIIVSHAEGILRELCQSGIYVRDRKAYWFEDIKEALTEYHKEGNKSK
jgi:capsular polysaccharide transport system ATP-binding protein